jgi:hypothetical protein
MNVEIKDYEGNTITTLTTSQIARNLNIESFTKMFDTFINYNFRGFEAGKEAGERLHATHRTLQASAYRFCLGVIAGLAEQEYYDLRNETAIKNAKKIVKMMDDGEIQKGYMI